MEIIESEIRSLWYFVSGLVHNQDQIIKALNEHRHDQEGGAYLKGVAQQHMLSAGLLVDKLHERTMKELSQ